MILALMYAMTALLIASVASWISSRGAWLPASNCGPHPIGIDSHGRH
jgi:hypothetical protein